MFDRHHADSPEDREALNRTLKDILHASGWAASFWDVVIKELRESHDIETDLVELAQNAPGLVEMFQIAALSDKGLIEKEAEKTLSEIIHSLVRIAFRAQGGDEKAANQLKVLHKVAYPFNYDLPATVIKNLADSYHISPHLARAWDVRELMYELSYVVEPTNFERSVLEGPVTLKTHNLGMRDVYQKAKHHIRRGSTLLSLAISLYIEQLEQEGIALEPRDIKRDLQKLKEWESANLKENSPYQLPLWNEPGKYPPASLPGIPIYSDGWKKLWRRGDKKKK